MRHRLVARFRAFFATPAREAVGLSVLGIAGLVCGSIGVYLLVDNGEDSNVGGFTPFGETVATPELTQSSTDAAVDTEPTSQPGASPESTQPGGTPGSTGDPSPAPTDTATAEPETPTPAATATPPPPTPHFPTATPTVEPTPTAILVVREYCPIVAAFMVTVGGRVTIDGEPAPSGTLVTLAFGGVPGPSTTVTFADGVAGYALHYTAGPEDCANSDGAAVSVIVDGVSYSTGHVVGDGQAFVEAHVSN